MDKKNVSMNDVAIAAGVSLKTVSRVINEPDSVRESTRDKVHAAMEALGFRANFAARSLKLGRYGCIGVVLFHLSGGAVDMIDGIADAAEERGFALTMIKKRAGEKMTLAEAARRMSQLPVDGMIFNLRQMVDDFDTFEAPKDLKTVLSHRWNILPAPPSVTTKRAARAWRASTSWIMVTRTCISFRVRKSRCRASAV